MTDKVFIPSFEYERSFLEKGARCVGVDEVGRGCLAGPVVTAAVVFPDAILAQDAALTPLGTLSPRARFDESCWWRFIKDSKLLKPATRDLLAGFLWRHCQVQVAWCSPQEIDRYNILHASLRAMRSALWPFQGLAQTVLVDGHLDPYKPQFGAPAGEAAGLGFTNVVPLVKGDQKSFTIGAASIVAKVFRDQWMDELDMIFPGYGFAKHKGYPTPEHQAGIRRQGVSVVHRLSFSIGQ